MDSIITEFLQAMHQQGIVPTGDILANGTIQRFHVEGDTPNKPNGWAVIHLGAFPGAVFGNWKTGAKHKWQLKTPTTPEERRAHKKAMRELYKTQEAEQLKRYSEATVKARSLIDNSFPADPAHNYLVRKQIQPHGIFQQDNTLLIPIYDGIALTSVQAVYADGSKQFLKGGKTKGCYYKLPRLETSGTDIIICEGFATASTLQEANPDKTVVVAFTANNLATVAQAMNRLCNAKITIACDNDQWGEVNTGLEKGRYAAAIVGGEMIYPIFDNLDTSSQPTDFNDYVRLGGDL